MPKLIRLNGGKKVVGQLTSLSQFQPRVNKVVTKAQRSMLAKARGIVQKVVYSHPVNKQFPRSGNTLAATDVKNEVVGSDAVVTMVLLDPSKASRSFSYSTVLKGLRSYSYLAKTRGDFDYYPSYVRRGVFFKKKMAPRDFKAEWQHKMAPRYVTLVSRAVRSFR